MEGEDMKADIEQTKQLFGLVQEDLIIGQLFGKTASLFGAAMLDGKLPLENWLYRTIFISNLREMMMAIARLTDDSDGTASLVRFLQHAEQNPENFQTVTSSDETSREAKRKAKDDFRNTIDSLKQNITELQARYVRLQTARDKVLAHTDRKYRNSTTSMGFGEDTLTEMKQYLEELTPIVVALSALMNVTHVSALNAEMEIEKEFQNLLDDRDPRSRAKHAAAERLFQRGQNA